MEAIQRIHHRAADRAAGIIDQDIHPTMILQHLLAETVAVVQIGDISAIGHRLTTVIADLLGQILQRIRGAGSQQHRGTGFGQLVGDTRTNTRAGASDQHYLAVYPAPQRRIRHQPLMYPAGRAFHKALRMGPQIRHAKGNTAKSDSS